MHNIWCSTKEFPFLTLFPEKNVNLAVILLWSIDNEMRESIRVLKKQAMSAVIYSHLSLTQILLKFYSLFSLFSPDRMFAQFIERDFWFVPWFDTSPMNVSKAMRPNFFSTSAVDKQFSIARSMEPN